MKYIDYLDINPNIKKETREGPITEKDLTPYDEDVYIVLKNDNSRDRFGVEILENLRGSTVLVTRSGPYTWRLISPLNGIYYNFMPELVQKIYTKDKFPQYFI